MRVFLIAPCVVPYGNGYTKARSEFVSELGINVNEVHGMSNPGPNP